MENMESTRNVSTGEIYRHFKGKLYQIIAVAKHSETGERLVIYQQLYGRYEVYARPLEMFVSEVDRVKYPDAAAKYRFELVNRRELEKDENNTGGMNSAESDTFKSGTVHTKSVAGSGHVQNINDTGSVTDVNHADDIKAISNAESVTDVNHSDNVSDINSADNRNYAVSDDTNSVNPFLIKFLDADTYEEKRNILIRIKGEINDRLIDDIAASMDVAVDRGDIDERFASLLNCVDMMAKFEVTRFR